LVIRARAHAKEEEGKREDGVACHETELASEQRKKKKKNAAACRVSLAQTGVEVGW
jgi:hypothetical protein